MNSWSSRHFSLSNPQPDGDPDSLPQLFRSVADLLEERGIPSDDVIDVVVSHQVEEDGPWWSITIYWSPEP